jgi:hypothetical protein
MAVRHQQLVNHPPAASSAGSGSSGGSGTSGPFTADSPSSSDLSCDANRTTMAAQQLLLRIFPCGFSLFTTLLGSRWHHTRLLSAHAVLSGSLCTLHWFYQPLHDACVLGDAEGERLLAQPPDGAPAIRLVQQPEGVVLEMLLRSARCDMLSPLPHRPVARLGPATHAAALRMVMAALATAEPPQQAGSGSIGGSSSGIHSSAACGSTTSASPSTAVAALASVAPAGLPQLFLGRQYAHLLPPLWAHFACNKTSTVETQVRGSSGVCVLCVCVCVCMMY